MSSCVTNIRLRSLQRILSASRPSQSSGIPPVLSASSSLHRSWYAFLPPTEIGEPKMVHVVEPRSSPSPPPTLFGSTHYKSFMCFALRSPASMCAVEILVTCSNAACCCCRCEFIKCLFCCSSACSTDIN